MPQQSARSGRLHATNTLRNGYALPAARRQQCMKLPVAGLLRPWKLTPGRAIIAHVVRTVNKLTIHFLEGAPSMGLPWSQEQHVWVDPRVCPGRKHILYPGWAPI